MANVTTVETKDGVVTIEAELLVEYNQRAQDILEQISELQKDFAEEVEALADATKLKKTVVAKYFKERFADKTKATKELGELFGTLDSIVAS